MKENLFSGLSLVIGVVLLSLYLMKLLKQPMIIGYIIAGTIITIIFPNMLQNNAGFEAFSTIGIAFLLFIVGMELNPALLKDIGKKSIITGVFQVLITFGLGFGLAYILGFDLVTAFYIAIGLSFSSTIVVLKLLGDKDDLESTYGRQSVGILIVQDIIVMLLMLVIVSMSGMELNNISTIVLGLLLKIVGITSGMIIISKYVLPRIIDKIAESQEFLFLFSIGWCVILASVFEHLGFGIEIGALAAGLSLATSSYRYEITSRIKPIKDFFVVMFFVLLGSHVHFSSAINYWVVIILSLFVLIIKPLIIAIILGYMGHTKKNNFLTGVTLGQISEFSFIFIAMGIANNHIKDPNILTIMTLIGLISITGSSYYLIYSHKLFEILKPIIKLLPGKWKNAHKKISTKSYEIILFGYGRFGSNLYSRLVNQSSVLIIDENPSIVGLLENEKKDCLYGDMSDIEFLKELNIKDTKMIVSSIKIFDENIIMLKICKKINPKLIVILVANHIEEAIKLYDQGADYVILPHYIGVDHTSLVLEEYGMDINKFIKNKDNQISKLKTRVTIDL